MRPRRPPYARALSPLKILTQILLLQAAYYGGAVVLILFTVLVAGKPFSVEVMLSWRSVRGDTVGGWMVGGCWGLEGGFGAIFLLLLVARSKLILDFTLTIHFIHLVVTSLYTGSIPTNRLWWAVQVFSIALMTTLGIWSCQWRELRPINFGGGTGGRDSEAQITREVEGSVQDQDVGYGRGRGGRGRDGGGEYEMVGMNEGSKSKGRG